MYAASRSRASVRGRNTFTLLPKKGILKKWARDSRVYQKAISGASSSMKGWIIIVYQKAVHCPRQALVSSRLTGTTRCLWGTRIPCPMYSRDNHIWHTPLPPSPPTEPPRVLASWRARVGFAFPHRAPGGSRRLEGSRPWMPSFPSTLNAGGLLSPFFLFFLSLRFPVSVSPPV